VPTGPIALIRELAVANRLWGAARIRGALLTPGIRVAKTTVQRHLRAARPPRPRGGGQTWAACLRNHAHETWARDFLPVTDLLFRPLYAFFVVARGSRRVVHVGITRHPTDVWVARQRREATPFDQRPRSLIRDRDSKYGPAFARVAASTGIVERRTAYRTPLQQATCERFLGSVRRDRRDHVLVLGEGHLRRVLREYTGSFNQHRPHQGRQHQAPDAPAGGPPQPAQSGTSCTLAALGGLHHAYQRAA